jgi:hypothetical protein
MSSANNPPSIDNPPSLEGIQGHVSIEIHDHDSQGSYYTALDDIPGSKRSPIIILDDDNKDCEGCEGGHEFRGCTKGYMVDEEDIPDEPHSL